MVRIRLRRTGLKNQPTFRVVVADKESPRDGRFIEILGSYNPRTNPITVDVKEDRVYEWMSKGAQPSLPTLKIFKSIGLMGRYDRFKAGEKLEALLAEAKLPVEAKPEVKKPSKKALKAEAASKEAAEKEKAKVEAAAAEAEAKPTEEEKKE